MKTLNNLITLAILTTIIISSAAFAGLPPEDVNPSWTNNWGERAAWSRAKLRRNTVGYFDCFDLPAAKEITAGSAAFERIDLPGEFINPAVTFSNKPVMMVFVNPSASGGWRNNRLTQALVDYQALFDEFNPEGVEFIGVYSDAPGNKTDMDARRTKAEAFFATNSFPGITAVEDVSGGITDYCQLSGSAMYDSSACVFKDANNQIVYREKASRLFADVDWLVLKRITDTNYNAAISQEFPAQSRTLPLVQSNSSPAALVYTDDFESYANSLSLKTAPRWGFHYETLYRVDGKAGITTGAGIGGSQAARIYADYKRGHEGAPGKIWHNTLEHDFPAPLTNGTFRFKIKNVTSLPGKRNINHKYEELDSMRATDLVITFFGSDRVAPSGYLLIKNGTFILVDENIHIRDYEEKGSLAVRDQQWETIEVRTVSGTNSEIVINGTPYGSLTSGETVGMSIRCRPGSEFLMDDAELSYTGDPATLTAEHTNYHAQVQLVQVGETPYPFTEAQKQTFQYRFNESVDRKQMFFHDLTPLNGTNFLMEKVHKPGEYVDIVEDRGGKPLYIHMSHSLPSEGVLKRVYTGSAKYLPVRKMTHALSHEIEIYVHSGQYWENSMMGYEENRLLRHEQAIAKLAARTILGEAHFWEVDEVCDQDHNLLAFDFDDRWNQWTGVNAGDSLWGGSHGSIPFKIDGFYLNANGEMTADSAGEYNYHEGQWPIMRASIDPQLAASMTNDFKTGSPIVRQATLPDVETTADGTYYRDNFDRYANNTELLTQPCWGFNYEWMNTRRSLGYRRYFMHRATIDPGEGVGGGNAMFVDCSHRLDRVAATPQVGLAAENAERANPQIGAISHTFPEVLTNGHFKCSVRQSLKSVKPSYGSRPHPDFTGRWFWLELLDENGEVIDSITTTGPVLIGTNDSQTSLCLDVNKQGEVSIAESWVHDDINAALPQLKTWHEIKVLAKPDSQVEVFVDETSIGTLPTNRIYGIKTYTRDGDGMYMDDVELFYDNTIPQAIITDTNTVNVPEGSNGMFNVKLLIQPDSATTVSVSRVSGDTNITVQSGAELIFSTNNWDTYQPVTLAASEDPDMELGSAVFRCSAHGMANKNVTATEIENDLGIIVSPTALSVPENGSESFNIKLTINPITPFDVTITHHSGDANLSISPDPRTLTFNSGNWDVEQSVTVSAADDPDIESGIAVFSCAGSNVYTNFVTCTEIEDDSLALVVSPLNIEVNEGGTNGFTVKLSVIPPENSTVTVSRVSGSTDLFVTNGGTIVFGAANWNIEHFVTIAAKEDPDYRNEEAVFRCEPLFPNTEGPVDVSAKSLDNDLTTESFQVGVSPAGYTTDDMDDTCVDTWRPTHCYGDDSSVYVVGNNIRRMLMRWDLTSLPSTAKVVSASITLSMLESKDMEVFLYDLKRSWVEGTTDGTGADWNTYDGSSPWQTAGAQGANDVGDIVFGTANLNTTTVNFELNATGVSCINNWLENPGENFGFLFAREESPQYQPRIYTSETSTPADRPRLSLGYYFPDGGAPTNASIIINNGEVQTTNFVVELALFAENTTPVDMQVSKLSDFSDATWIDYQTNYVWTFEAPFGEKTVYARFSDGGAGISETASDTIDIIPEPAGIVFSIQYSVIGGFLIYYRRRGARTCV